MNQELKRHPFLDDLAEDVSLISSVLRQEVTGRDRVLKVVKAGAAQYLRQTPTFLRDVDDRRFFEYDLELDGGIAGKGLVSILRNDHGQVTQLNIAFSPLGAVLAMADGARASLKDDFDAELFL